MVSAPAARPHVAMLTQADARDPRTWSGTPHFMARGLERHVGDVEYVSPADTRMLTVRRGINRVHRQLLGRRILPAQSWSIARRFARQAERQIAKISPDAIVAPAGSSLVADLSTTLPLVYSSDATVRLMIDYNSRYKNLTLAAIREADALERAAIRRSDLMIYPTDWAARSAIEDYGADPEKVHIVPYGANLAYVPARSEALAARPGPMRRIIFVGVDWAMKGGEITLAAVRDIRTRGLDVELTVVGCSPPAPVTDAGVTFVPFLDKNDPAQAARLSELYLAADLLILPTRCECYGIVFCEAAAHGVPSIATATGGVPDVVQEGITGHTLPHEAGGSDYADVIEGILNDPNQLMALRRSSRDDFEHRLNWDIWGKAVGDLMKPMLKTECISETV